MRIISMMLVLLFMCSSQALAITPVNLESIQEAQNYGKLNAAVSLEDFLHPWTVYEEKADKLSITSEHACLYTPFLFMATDAREKSLSGKKIVVQDSEKILSDYAGILSFSVMLLGNNEKFAQHSNVVLKQDKKIIKPFQATIPVEAEKASWKSGVFTVQCYFYFLEKEINLNKRVDLVITTGDKAKHYYYFYLDNIK